MIGLAFSPDDRWIATGDYDNVVKLYEVSTGRLLMRYEGHRAGIRCCAFTPDGRRLVTAGDDKSARLWDVRTGRELINYDGITGVVYGHRRLARRPPPRRRPGRQEDPPVGPRGRPAAAHVRN